MSSESSDTPVRRKRVRQGYGARVLKGRAGLLDLFRTQQFARFVNVVMVIALVGYLFVSIHRFNDEMEAYDDRPLYATKGEYLYGFGIPQLVRNSPAEAWHPVSGMQYALGFSEWGYDSGTGGRFDIRFAPESGRSTRVSCGTTGPEAGVCPAAFGIKYGAIEDQSAYILGKASNMTLQGATLIASYPAIGLQLELRQFKVERITLLGAKESTIAQLPLLLRWMIP